MFKNSKMVYTNIRQSQLSVPLGSVGRHSIHAKRSLSSHSPFNNLVLLSSDIYFPLGLVENGTIEKKKQKNTLKTSLINYHVTANIGLFKLKVISLPICLTGRI